MHSLDRALDLVGFARALHVSGTCFYGLGSQVAVGLGKPYTLKDRAVGLSRFVDNKTLYLEAGYCNNEEEKDAKGLLLHATKGRAHDAGAFLVDEHGQLFPMETLVRQRGRRSNIFAACCKARSLARPPQNKPSSSTGGRGALQEHQTGSQSSDRLERIRAGR